MSGDVINSELLGFDKPSSQYEQFYLFLPAELKDIQPILPAKNVYRRRR